MTSGSRLFRPDLEGLRGVAILLVVGFHAGVSLLDGGFVGVDVFFVLSGFFITGLLAAELELTGDVDLAQFYARRAVRLLPALLLVLLATLAMTMWLYAPIDRAAVASNARAVALYSANVEFARNTVHYFSAGNNPLLHTWSLGVEEQFYLVWPLLFLAVAVAYASKPGTDEIQDAGRRRLLLAISSVGVVSFIATLWLTRVSQQWAFYGMPTRVWEFALGGALALLLVDKRDAATSPAATLQLLGVLAIGIAVLTYDRAIAYPGMAALLPALGAVALVIGGARAPESIVSRSLTVPPLRWLGRLSYAWYLWHWPLMVTAEVLDWRIGVAGRLAWSAAALIPAWLTYHYIEQRARGEAPFGIPRNWQLSAALAASAAVAILAHVAMKASAMQASRLPQKIFAAAREDRKDHGCWAATIEQLPPEGACVFGDKRGSTTVALLGDSHAEHWLAGIDRIGRERGWKVVAMVKGGCPVADMPELAHGRTRRNYSECTRYREAMLRRIVSMRPDFVILSSWDHYIAMDGGKSDWQVTPDGWRRGLRRTYSRLAAANIPVVAIRGTPRTWFDVPSCLSRHAARLPFAPRCEYTRSGSLSKLAIAAQDDAARGLPVGFVDMNDAICSSATCPVMRNGIVLFTDDNHLTASFTRSLAPILEARIRAAIRRL